MPDFGRLTKDHISLQERPAAGGIQPAPWTLPNATILQVTYEVDQEETLDLLPEMAARPVPTYARFLALLAPESPAGPFSAAFLLPSCRANMAPKQFVAACVASTESARQAFASLWLMPVALGELRFQRVGPRFEADVSDADGRPLVHAESANVYAVETSMIRYDPLVVLKAVAGEEPELLQVGLEIEPREAWLAKGTAFEPRTDDWSSVWYRLRNWNMVSTTLATGTVRVGELTALPAPGMGGGGGLP
jgi:hypothetical protein